MKEIKVVVVDDSALMRKLISDMINTGSEMEVIATARNGKELLDLLKEKTPDVITLDIEMPILDGVATLRELKKRNISTPVIMLSSLSQRGTRLTLECLEAGAVDFLTKPSGSISLDIDKVRDELIEKIRAIYNRNKVTSKNNQKKVSDNLKVDAKPKVTLVNKIEAVVIGASTGGPKALYDVITPLPKKLGVPIFIVQHMPVGFTKAFAERLDSNSAIKVVEAKNNDIIEKDVVYVAPGGYHMEISKNKLISLNTEPTLWGVRPAVDKLFISASEIYSSAILSIVLTGMGRDGAMGTVQIKKNGGITIAQDRASSIIYGMPRAAYETGSIDMVIPLNSIADEIIKIVLSDRR